MSKIYKSIINKIHNFDPTYYSKSRNYIDGNVSRLSPYISRGVISTKNVAEIILEKGCKKYQIEKFIQELAWRDYWQKIWQSIVYIDTDLKNTQEKIYSNKFPYSIENGLTEIKAIDKAIKELKNIGYIHNHIRMYIASICCNIGNYHWLNCAKWMYYHLIDGDWGSNALSWQWVAATNSHKKYYANQQNINKYCHTNDRNTFLDKTYDELIELNDIPKELKKESLHNLKNFEFENTNLNIDQKIPTLIYTTYNLDPNWKKEIKANRILLLEPDHFNKYPISKNVFEFIFKLSIEIEGLQIVTLNFEELFHLINDKSKVFYKEHPFSKHFVGNEEPRDWLFKNIEADGSFFKFWKKGIKEYKLI